MKTHLNLAIGLFCLTAIIGCERDELDSKELNSQSIENDIKSYNNGMIKSYNNDAVIIWNQALSDVLDNRIPQPAEARIYTMVTLAIHDALNNVVPKYETYALNNQDGNAEDVSKKNIHDVADAAVAQAAHDVITLLYPPSTSIIDELLESNLSGILDIESRNEGILIGKDVVSALLDKRQGDFSFGFTSFVGPSGPGKYQADYMPYAIANNPIWPANAVYAANLGNFTPFGISSADQFRSEGPLSTTSVEYTKDYNEIKELGCANCPNRAAKQSEIGTFWHESNASMMNRIARTLVLQHELNGWEAARLIALVQMGVMDSFIASFDGYFHYNFWRPISAIRNGDNDGNPETIASPSWVPVYTTPPTPEFPSTNGIVGGSTAAILKLFFKDKITPFVTTSPYFLPGAERTMFSYDQIADENSLSRLYVGFHFRHSIKVGKSQGYQLGKFVFDNNLKDLKNPK